MMRSTSIFRERGTATTTIIPPLFNSTKHEAPKCPRYPFTSPDGRKLPYYWLRKKDDPKYGPQIREYLDKENKYCEKLLGNAPNVLFQEIKARIKESDAMIPARSRNYFYYTIAQEGEEYEAYYRRHVCADPHFTHNVSKAMALDPEHATIPKNLPGSQLLLDLNTFSKEEKKGFVTVGWYAISPNDQRALFSLDLCDGREVFTLIAWEYPDAMLDVAKKSSSTSSNFQPYSSRTSVESSSSATASSSAAASSLPPSTTSSPLKEVPSTYDEKQLRKKKRKILRMDGSEKDGNHRFGAEVAWGNDDVFFYTKLDASLRPFQVWRHDFCPPDADEDGDGGTTDTLIFEEKDETFLINHLERSYDDCVVMFTTSSKMSSEEWYVPTSNPRLPWRCIRKRRPDMEYFAVHHRSFFVPCLSAGTTSAVSLDLPPDDVPHTWTSQPTWLIFHNYGDSLNFQLDYAKSDVTCDEHLSETEKLSNKMTIDFERRLEIAELKAQKRKPPKKLLLEEAAALAAEKEQELKKQQKSPRSSKRKDNGDDLDDIIDEDGLMEISPQQQAEERKAPPRHYVVDSKKFPLLYKNESYHTWKSLICYDPSYTIEGVKPMRDFTLLSIRTGGFPKLLILPNFARSNTIQQLRYAEATTSIEAKLPPLYQRFVSLSWALTIDKVKEIKSSGSSKKSSNSKRSSSSSKLKGTASTADLSTYHIGVETDPNQLQLIEQVTAIGLSDIYSFEDHTFRVTANNPLYPYCELDVITDLHKFDQQNHQAIYDQEASIAMISNDEKVPYFIDTLKFAPVKSSAGKPYDPSEYAVALEWVHATKSTCDPHDRELNIYAEDGKTPLPVKIPVLLRFKKAVCQKYLVEIDPVRAHIPNMAFSSSSSSSSSSSFDDSTFPFNVADTTTATARQVPQITPESTSSEGAATTATSTTSSAADEQQQKGSKEQQQQSSASVKNTVNSGNSNNNISPPPSSNLYPLNFGNPLVMWGYAGYGDPTVGATEDGELNTALLSLLDRGVIYAEAGVRGGNEMGNHWHNAGRLKHKINSFTDFIDCGEALIERGWAHPQRLAIRGCSAGGLLVGSAMSLRPDLWCAVSADVPFVDAITTMGMDIKGKMNPTGQFLPLVQEETLEWGFPCVYEGCPESNKIDYECMRKYSPTDNVPSKDTIMPHIYIETGFEDCRVQYFEPASWAALLRYNWEPASKEAGRVLAMKTNFGAGHDGASGRYESFKKTAQEFAFFLGAFGMKVKKPMMMNTTGSNNNNNGTSTTPSK